MEIDIFGERILRLSKMPEQRLGSKKLSGKEVGILEKCEKKLKNGKK